MRWRNVNHNLSRPGAECQRPCKNQSDQSLMNHSISPFRTTKLPTHPPASRLPGPSASEEVIDNQQDDRADNRHKEAVEVEPADARGAKDVEQPAAGKSADNSQQDVEQDALTSPVY